MRQGRRSWKQRRDRVNAAVVAVIGAFIVWTAIHPARDAAWRGPDLVPARSPTSLPAALPLPVLVLLLVAVLVIYGVNRSRLL